MKTISMPLEEYLEEKKSILEKSTSEANTDLLWILDCIRKGEKQPHEVRANFSRETDKERFWDIVRALAKSRQPGSER